MKKSEKTESARQHWRKDPVAFIRGVLIDPETKRPFELYLEEETFLRTALSLTPSGELPYAELLFSAPMKSGKTALAAMIVLYVIIALAGQNGEAYCVANDFEQAAGRVFQAIVRILRASPLLRRDVKITGNRIVVEPTGSVIAAIASDFAGAAGSNRNIAVFDELWGYRSTAAERLWNEMVPVPTRKVSCRLTVTYAGFSGESTLLEGLYRRAMAGEIVGPDLYRNGTLLAYWTHELRAPWQRPKWREQMREQLPANAYLRQIENYFVTSESPFIDMAWWDECVDPEARPLVAERELPVWVGVDASVKRDSTAIVVCAWDEKLKRVRVVWHRVFQPSPNDPLDFEVAIEGTLKDLARRFEVRSVRFDPYQMVSLAQRLTSAGIPMHEFPQSVPNLTESSTNLYDLIKGRNLALYRDDGMRLAANRAIALETSRGWRIAKEKQSHKIDVIVALAMGALGVVQEGQNGDPGILRYYERLVRNQQAELDGKQVDAEVEEEADEPSLEEIYNAEMDKIWRNGG